MTTTEERKELLAIAKVLHEELRAFNKQVNHTINKLIEAADELKLVSADEIQAGTSVTKREVVYHLPPPITEARVEAAMQIAKTLVKGKRACSVCREAGHRAANCPNAHLVREKKKAEVAARPVKRTRAPMSPERRAKAAENLKKARAAKGQK